MKLKNIFLFILIALVTSSCASYKHRKLICSGLLQSGISADAFKAIWGLPTRTKIVSGQEMMSANIGRFGGGFLKAKQLINFGFMKIAAYHLPSTQER